MIDILNVRIPVKGKHVPLSGVVSLSIYILVLDELIIFKLHFYLRLFLTTTMIKGFIFKL